MEAESAAAEAPRDQAGQFTSEKFGIQSVEADQGYKSYEPPQPGESDGTMEAAFDEYQKKRRGGESEPIVREMVHADTGEKVADNLAVTVEQAAAANALSTSWEQRDRERTELDRFQGAVDAARAQAIADGASAEDLGLAKADVPAQIEPPANAATPEETAAAEAAGLDLETHRALQLPQVREAVEQEFAKADNARQTYESAVAVAQSYAQAALVDHLPELANVPPEQWEAAITILHQQNPDRVTNALGVLQRYSLATQAQQQLQQQRAAEQEQAVETWVRSQDARLKDFGVELNSEVVNDVVAYSTEELGIGRERLAQILHANPILRSAEFTRVMADAAAYRSLKQAPAKAIPKTIPSVQRPGSGRVPGGRTAEDLTELRSRASKSGSMEDVYALYNARKRARN